MEPITAEEARLEADRKKEAHWRRWGPYLSERQWGTVREDYSPDGSAWDYFPHEHARSRAYRWGEDGIAGISDNHQRLCFALGLWNGEDPILKERLFGLTGTEGNHGEDVKEEYYYLDNTPTHAYMKYLYKYPQQRFPYGRLVAENGRRDPLEPEFELRDSGVFDQDRYFDVAVEYAKGAPDDILILIRVQNRGPEACSLHLLPTLWYRNTWSWEKPDAAKPGLQLAPAGTGITAIATHHPTLGTGVLFCESPLAVLFTENETNNQKLFGAPNPSPYVKDAFHDYLIEGRKAAVNPDQVGTKAGVHYRFELAPGQNTTVRLRLTASGAAQTAAAAQPFADFEVLFAQRRREADEFYAKILPPKLDAEHQNIQRQAYAGMLWSKQFYHYVVDEWVAGDPDFPPPPARRQGRNHEWRHLYNEDILSMPDKWEYPWFASWDLAFHCIPLAMLDPEFAKKQLMLMTREWYMHPNGQIPAYEWSFGDVNPPVHAWAAWRVYKIEKKRFNRTDRLFLERVFQKLLLNFTWWVNRKDVEGNNVFEGGFLGLDNISVFDRSRPLPTGGHLEQSDSTSWMAMYCLNMLKMALELARENPSYEDIASKFFEHFLYIADAMNHIGEDGIPLWNDADGFFYDVVHLPDGRHLPLQVRSLVGLIPLFAVETIEPEDLSRFPGFRKRMHWFIENRPDLRRNIACTQTGGIGQRRLLSLVGRERLRRILAKMLDESEFLSPYGIRSVSRYHHEHPFVLHIDGSEHRVDYAPGESTTHLFGGNSNWRGPVWFPVNYLLIESLQKLNYYYGESFKVECPTGSGREITLWEVATEITHRLIHLFTRDQRGRRPALAGGNGAFDGKDLLNFHEYFHGDDGTGIGASHQTGWTGLVSKLIQQCGEYCFENRGPVLLKEAQGRQREV